MLIFEWTRLKIKDEKTPAAKTQVSNIAEFLQGNSPIITYRCLQLLNHEFNSSLARICLPWLQFALIVFPATLNYILIRLHSELDTLTLSMLSLSLCITIGIVSLVYPIGASIGTDSVKYLHALKVKSNRWKRQTSSCLPLKIKMGSVAVLGRFTVLKTMHLIVFWTVRYILLFSKRVKME